MKKLIFLSMLLMLGISTNTLAKVIHIYYFGDPVVENVHLEPKDIVELNVHVKVEACYTVSVTLKQPYALEKVDFNLATSFAGGLTGAADKFVQSFCCNDNPGFPHYTYYGHRPIDLVFSIHR